MKFQIFSSNEWLYPDQLVKKQPSSAISLNTAKNASASAQVLLNVLPLGKKISFEASIFSEFLTISKEIPVFVAKNSGNGIEFFETDWEKAKKNSTRQAPFEVFDSLAGLVDSSSVIESTTEAYLLTFEIPLDAERGRFSGEISVKIANQELIIPLEINIYEATVPEKENLMVSNWYWVKEMADHWQVEPWSDAHFALIEQYGSLMRRTRQTHFWIPKEALIVNSENEHYHFDFSRIKRLIELMLALGFSYIEGPLIAHRGNFGDAFFLLTVGDHDVRALSAEGRNYLIQYLAAWREFLLENGWLELLQQHVADEPTDACAQEFQELVKIIRDYLPNTKLMEAVDTHDFGKNGQFAPDILIPTNMTYAENPEAFEALRAKGRELWFYTCCYPNGPYLNRFLDMPLIRTRLLHWANRKYNLTGYLHWGLNAGLGIDPYRQEDPYFPCGDMFMTYPAPEGPRSSMRLEMMRQGIQDFELLYQLSSDEAEKVIASVLTDFSHFDESPENLEQARLLLLQKLEKQNEL